MSTGKLSERFAKLQATATPNVRIVRAEKNTARQSNQRAAQTATRRGIVAAPAAQNNNNKPRKPTNVGKATRPASAVGTRRPNVKGGAARARKPANNTRKGKNPNANKGGKGKGKEGKASQEDLDKEMDAYWFEAGKGPNPELVNLDNDLDSYFLSKKAEGGSLTITAPESA